MQQMKSMGLWQPWGTAVASWSKDVENRTVISEKVIGTDIAIYATSSRPAADVAEDAEAIRQLIRDDFRETDEFGCILAICHVSGAMHPKRGPIGGWQQRHSESGWYNGAGAYALSASAPLLHPVSFRGAQYMKALSTAELAESMRQVRLCAALRLHAENWPYVPVNDLQQLAVVGMLDKGFKVTQRGREALMRRRPQRFTSERVMTGAWLREWM